MWDLLAHVVAASFSGKRLKLQMERINGELQPPACAKPRDGATANQQGSQGPFPPTRWAPVLPVMFLLWVKTTSRSLAWAYS